MDRCDGDMGRCPKLIWIGPLALKKWEMVGTGLATEA